jgi:hypothetical protein
MKKEKEVDSSKGDNNDNDGTIKKHNISGSGH